MEKSRHSLSNVESRSEQRPRGWSLSDRWLSHMLLWPALLALCCVFAYPLGYSFSISLHAYDITARRSSWG